MDFAAPLGTRAALSARIVELLPGTAFDGDGRGTFRRGGYQIRFEYAGLEPTSIEVALERAEGFTALKRLVEKTGWQAVDPAGGVFIDLDRSRTAGAIVPVVIGALQVPPKARGPRVPQRRVWQGAIACLLIAGTGMAWAWTRRGRGAEAARPA